MPLMVRFKEKGQWRNNISLKKDKGCVVASERLSNSYGIMYQASF